MRNARIIDQLVITSDNSAAIGQKELDAVQVPDEVTSYFSTRVTLLEQLAAYALPEEIVLLNFTGGDAWQRYVTGIEQIFEETNLPLPTISGSTESNMPTLQSGFGITMIGHLQKEAPSLENLIWYTYGRPLVGNDLLAHQEQVANLSLIVQALQQNIITQVVPVGSKGVQYELEQLLPNDEFAYNKLPYDCTASAGPSTIVLLGITAKQREKAEQFFIEFLTKLI